MKRRVFLKSMIGAGLLPFVPDLSYAQDFPAKVLKINYYNQWKPISFAGESEAAQGMLIDILDGVLSERMGMMLVHQGLPWARAQYDVEKSKADALCAFPSAKRKEFLYFAQEISLQLNVLFLHSSDQRVVDVVQNARSFSDLKDLMFGELYANDWAKEVLKDHDKILHVSSFENLIKQLGNRRVDIVMAPDLTGRYLVNQMGYDDRVIATPKSFVRRQIPLHLGIRKDYPKALEILEKFDEEMRIFKESGRDVEVVNRYLR